MNRKNSLALLILVSLILFGFVYPAGVNSVTSLIDKTFKSNIPDLQTRPFILGLDLLGGAHLVYEADLNRIPDGEKSEAMEGVRDVIERRVNLFGVSEPVVQVSGDNRLIVELAGITDINQAIQLIGETPFLEFKEQKPDFEAIVTAQQNGQRLDEDPFQVTGLNGNHLSRATVAFDQQTFIPIVSLDLNAEGAELFKQITARNVGKVVAIYLDGFIISAPVVQSEISGGQAQISGSFTPQEAKMLATRLNSGALPVPVSLISQQTVGASLGADSLNKSLQAGLYGLLLVAIFMIVFYRLPGLISVAALLIYAVIVLSVYKFIPVTLTLAGMAGFILSLGMAVDANVLIFARMREELKAGKPLATSVNEGFSRAWLSVRDSHITTLIGSFILYFFTTSIVQGFALTLGIGVLASLFTATTATRMFLRLFTGPRWEKRKWLF